MQIRQLINITIDFKQEELKDLKNLNIKIIYFLKGNG